MGYSFLPSFRVLWIILLLVVVFLLPEILTSCGGGGSPPPAPPSISTPPPTGVAPPSPPVTPPSPPASGAEEKPAPQAVSGGMGDGGGGETLGGGGSCQETVPIEAEIYPTTIIEPLTPPEGAGWVESRPFISARIHDYQRLGIVAVKMSVDYTTVLSTWDSMNCIISYTPSEDLADNSVHVVKLFVLYSDYSFTEGGWSFRVDSENPDIWRVSFPVLSEDPYVVSDTEANFYLSKRIDPQYHLNPLNWTLTYKPTGQEIHPSEVIPTPGGEHLVKLRFDPPLPDNRPEKYRFSLSGKPGKDPKVFEPPDTSTGGGEPPPDPAPPCSTSFTIQVLGRDPGEDTAADGHWAKVKVTAYPPPNGERASRYMSRVLEKEITYPPDPEISVEKGESVENWGCPECILKNTWDAGQPGPEDFGGVAVGEWVWYGMGPHRYKAKLEIWCLNMETGIPQRLASAELMDYYEGEWGETSYPTAAFELMTAQERGEFIPTGGDAYPKKPNDPGRTPWEDFKDFWQDDNFKRANGGRLYLKIEVNDRVYINQLHPRLNWYKTSNEVINQTFQYPGPDPNDSAYKCLQKAWYGGDGVPGVGDYLYPAYIVDREPVVDHSYPAFSYEDGFEPDFPPDRDKIIAHETYIYFLPIGLLQFDCFANGIWRGDGGGNPDEIFKYTFFSSSCLPPQPYFTCWAGNWKFFQQSYTPQITLDRPVMGSQYVNLEKDLIESPYPRLPDQRMNDVCHDLGAGFHENYGDEICFRFRITVNGLPAGQTRFHTAYLDASYDWNGGATPTNPDYDSPPDPVPPVEGEAVWYAWDNHRHGYWESVLSPLKNFYGNQVNYNNCGGGRAINQQGRAYSSGRGESSPFAVVHDLTLDPPPVNYEHAGKAWCSFHPGAFGGDNFRLKVCFTWNSASTTGTNPSGWNACVGGAVVVPGTLTVWRKAWLWQTQMTPDFNPLADRVRGAFDDGFVEVVMRSLDTGNPHQSPLSICSESTAWAHNSGTYPYPHPPPIHTPHHAGVDHLWSTVFGMILGVYCPGDVHSFTAVGYIRTLTFWYRYPWIKTQQNSVHEMGHNLGALEHPDTSHDWRVCAGLAPRDRTVMRYSCGTPEWYEQIHYFSVAEIELLRQRIRSLYQ